MNYFKPVMLIITMFFFFSCTSDDNTNEPSSIQIGNYVFNFETKFTLEELQGIDSYVGKVNGSGISLSFDHGWYTRPASNLPTDEYIVTEDEINGHYRQIIKPLDSKLNYTQIHLFKISDSIDSLDGYDSLSMATYNLSTAEQEMILEVFYNVEIVE